MAGKPGGSAPGGVPTFWAPAPGPVGQQPDTTHILRAPTFVPTWRRWVPPGGVYGFVDFLIGVTPPTGGAGTGTGIGGGAAIGQAIGAADTTHVLRAPTYVPRWPVRYRVETLDWIFQRGPPPFASASGTAQGVGGGAALATGIGSGAGTGTGIGGGAAIGVGFLAGAGTGAGIGGGAGTGSSTAASSGTAQGIGGSSGVSSAVAPPFFGAPIATPTWRQYQLEGRGWLNYFTFQFFVTNAGVGTAQGIGGAAGIGSGGTVAANQPRAPTFTPTWQRWRLNAGRTDFLSFVLSTDGQGAAGGVGNASGVGSTGGAATGNIRGTITRLPPSKKYWFQYTGLSGFSSFPGSIPVAGVGNAGGVGGSSGVSNAPVIIPTRAPTYVPRWPARYQVENLGRVDYLSFVIQVAADQPAGNQKSWPNPSAPQYSIALRTWIGKAPPTVAVTNSGAGSAQGIGGGAGISQAGVGQGTAQGIGGGAAVGTGIASAIGSGAGQGAATATGASTGASTGSGQGIGAASAIGASTAAATGSGQGIGGATAFSQAGVGAGTAQGIGGATATGTGINSAVGNGQGIGGASGVGASTAAANTNIAAGRGSASAFGTGILSSPGTAAGQGAGAALGTGLKPAIGTGQGIGGAAAIGQSGAQGVAAGIGGATAIGRSTAASVGSARGIGGGNGAGFRIVHGQRFTQSSRTAVLADTSKRPAQDSGKRPTGTNPKRPTNR